MRAYIIADNQFITKEGISALIKKQSKAEIIVSVKTKEELIEKLNAYPTAVVVMDYTLFDFVGMQQLLIVKSAAKNSSWLLFSDELSEHFLRYVLVSDPTTSVVMKHDSEEEITNALQSAAYGVPYICETAENILQKNDLSNIEKISDKLTSSEKLILREIALGKTTKEIAYEKNLSFHTVNSHRKNIFRKLEINNLYEAIRYAIRSGIFDVMEYYI